MTTNLLRFRLPVAFLLLACAADAVLLLESPLWARIVAAGVLVFVLPGAALLSLVVPMGRQLPLGERIVLGAGASVAVAVWLLWVLYLLPLRLHTAVAVAALNLSPALFAALAVLRGLRARAPAGAAPPLRLHRDARFLAILAAIVGVQLFYSIANLQYAELVYDERVVAHSALNVLLGKEASLFDMPRGPAQILLAMWFMRLTGSLVEWVMRLPFALCAGLAAAAFALIARARLAPSAVLLAALLFAFEGLLLSLSRWLQYQIFVLAMVQLALYCAYRAWATRRSRLANRYWLLCALFEGLALLGHYDAAFAAPALLYLFAHAHWRRWRARSTLLMAGLIGGAILLIGLPYYLLLTQYPNAMSLFELLYVKDSGRLGLARAPFNNLNTFFWDLMYFDSAFRLPLLCAGLVVAALAALKRPLSRFAASAWLAGVLALAITIWQPDLLAFGDINFSIVPFCLVVLLGCAAVLRDPFWVAMLLWLSSVFFITGFWMARPVDHFFLGLPPLILIGVKGLSEACVFIRRRLLGWHASAWRRSVLAFCCLWVVVLAAYAYLQAVAHVPTTLALHPERAALPFAQLSQPRTLFPSVRVYNEGWRAVAGLYESGTLRGEFATNIGKQAQWYVYQTWEPPQPRPRYFIISSYYNSKDVTSGIPLDFAETFHYWGSVDTGGEHGLAIYERNAAHAAAAERVVPMSEYEGAWYDIASLTRLERLKANQRDEAAFFALAGALQARGQPADAVAIEGQDASALLNRYYAGDLPYVDPRVAELGAYRRLWGVFWQTDGGPVEWALAQRAYALTTQWIGNLRLALYGVAPDTPLQAVGARFAEVATLQRGTVLPQTVVAGDWLPLELEWQAAMPADAAYKVFIHVADAQYVPHAQVDAEPLAGLKPTTRWTPHEILRDRIGVSLPASLAPGRYQILVGLYGVAPGSPRLPVFAPDGTRYPHDAVPLGWLTISSR